MTLIPFRTAQGLLDLAALEPSAFSAAVLADTLAKVNRFNGRTPEPWSVASHSVLVSMLCRPRSRGLALLHDAHEAFIGDLTLPAEDLLCGAIAGHDAVRSAIWQTRLSLDSQIRAAWGVAWEPDDQVEVQYWDHIACRAEMALFLGDDEPPADAEDAEDLDRAIGLIRDLPLGGDWRAARDAFLDHAHNLASIGQLRLPAGPANPTRMLRAV